MRKLTLRKDRQCDYCFDANEMKKGKSAYFEEGRTGRYDDKDNQIGVDFYRNYACIGCHSEMTTTLL